MNVPRWIKPFFIFAGLCDGLLGISFLIIPANFFSMAGITLPTPSGYLQFISMLLVVLAIMYFNIAISPLANRNLILYGILIKLAFCVAVLLNFLSGYRQYIWLVFGLFDIFFITMFILVNRILRRA